MDIPVNAAAAIAAGYRNGTIRDSVPPTGIYVPADQARDWRAAGWRGSGCSGIFAVLQHPSDVVDYNFKDGWIDGYGRPLRRWQ